MKYSMIALLSSLALLSACETAPTDSDGSASGSGYNGGYNDGTNGYGSGTSGELAPNVSDRIFFATDSSMLSSEAQTMLRGQYEWLQSNPNVSITIEGHCDERGTREYNLALGERRANAVKNFLTNLGLSSGRISTVSYGKERPAVSGTGASVWSQNRRAVTVISNY